MTEKKLFSVPVLGAMVHSNKTREILETQENQSAYIRSAILAFAEKRGFEIFTEEKPAYVPDDTWLEIAEIKSRQVDYTYVSAFHWLKSLLEFEACNNSSLMREIIEDSVNHHQ